MEALLKKTRRTVFAIPAKEAELVDAILTAEVPLKDLFEALEGDMLLRQLVVQE